jgi:hypothetical protein
LVYFHVTALFLLGRERGKTERERGGRQRAREGKRQREKKEHNKGEKVERINGRGRRILVYFHVTALFSLMGGERGEGEKRNNIKRTEG